MDLTVGQSGASADGQQRRAVAEIDIELPLHRLTQCVALHLGDQVGEGRAKGQLLRGKQSGHVDSGKVPGGVVQGFSGQETGYDGMGHRVAGQLGSVECG